MQTTNIANTDLNVSILGLGTVKLGRNTAVKYPQAFLIPNDQEVIELLNISAECGINLLDTAPAYGNSEQRLGKLLKHSPHPWIIATKAGEIFNESTGKSTYNFTPEYIQNSIENSLRKLQRDVLDIVQIHSDGNDEKIIHHYGALEVLDHLKKKGLIRVSGMSTKTITGGMLAIKHSDLVMVTHNLTYKDELPVIEHAHHLNKAVFIKKAFASGKSVQANSANAIAQSLESIYQHNGVSSVILGSINPKHVKENALRATEIYYKTTGVE